MMAIVTNMKDENEALGIARTLMNKVITKKKILDYSNAEFEEFQKIDNFYDQYRVLGVYVNRHHRLLRDDTYVITNFFAFSAYEGKPYDWFKYIDAHTLLETNSKETYVQVNVTGLKSDIKMYANTVEDVTFVTNEFLPLLNKTINHYEQFYELLAEYQDKQERQTAKEEIEQRVKIADAKALKKQQQFKERNALFQSMNNSSGDKQGIDQVGITKLTYPAGKIIISMSPIPAGYEYETMIYGSGSTVNVVSPLGDVDKATGKAINVLANSIGENQALFNLRINTQVVSDAPGVIVQAYGDLCNRLI
ncbi:hypothetical protein [Lactiplantibacillus plantarum]|nr:hypothetical protein [Lactiplantibacillus plantarum]PRO87203.1 hypothetical protein C6Y13_12005 [Lactiplantibacillus pentosus]